MTTKLPAKIPSDLLLVAPENAPSDFPPGRSGRSLASPAGLSGITARHAARPLRRRPPSPLLSDPSRADLVYVFAGSRFRAGDELGAQAAVDVLPPIVTVDASVV
jgi:hypothetical protein